jgi:hypothetical protein
MFRTALDISPTGEKHRRKRERMIEISIPGFGNLTIEHLVLDYNGTIAFDGELIDGVKDLLQILLHPSRLIATLRS